MQGSGKEALQWALIAQQYHPDLLEAEAVHHIVKNFVEVESLGGYDELSQRLLRHISRGLARETWRPLDTPAHTLGRHNPIHPHGHTVHLAPTRGQ